MYSYYKLRNRKSLIEEALKTAEIIEAAAKANLSSTFLQSTMMERYDQIIGSMSNEIDHFGTLVQQLENAEEALDSIKIRYPLWLKIWKRLWILFGLILGLWILLLIAAGLHQSWELVLAVLGSIQSISGTAIYIVALLIVLLVRYFGMKRAERRHIYERYLKQTALGIDPLEQQVKTAKKVTEKRIVDNVLLPELRSIINAQLSPSYEDSFTPIGAPGLAEVYDPEYEIPTRAKKQVGQLIQSMPGGSIGIAGPRGSGKTTLLWAFCKRANQKFKNRDAISVLTLVPVEYVGRDYILHLFSSICQRYLEVKQVPFRAEWEYLEPFRGFEPRKQLFSNLGIQTALLSH